MDERVKRALEQWPNVPDVYGWLALDRHGQWWLDGETITHPNLIAFINRNYARQPDGRYAFQNGPQRVFVELALTPYIARLEPDGGWRLHTGAALTAADAVYLDADGRLLFAFGEEVAALDDRDLYAALERFVDPAGRPLTAEDLEAALAPDAGQAACLPLDDGPLTLQFLPAGADLAEHFGFVARPDS